MSEGKSKRKKRNKRGKRCKRTTKPGEVKIRRCRLCGVRLKTNWLYCDKCKKIIKTQNVYSDPVSDYSLNYD